MSQNPPENPYGEQRPPADQPIRPGQSYPAYQQGQPGQPGQSYPPPQGQPGGYAPPQKQGGAGLAIAALIVGIFALLLCWTVVFGIVLGLIALVLGIIASGKAKRGTARGRGMAITGIVLGLIGALISVGIIVVSAIFINSDTGKNLQDCVNNAQTQADRDQCSRDFQNDLQN